MSPKQQIWTVTLGMAVVVFTWQYYPRERSGAVVSAPAVQNLFDTQAVPSSLPSERPRLPQSQPPGIPGGIPVVKARSKGDARRAVTLGVDRPARENETFASGRGKFRWLGNVFALPEELAGSHQVIEERPGYVFVKVAGGEVPAGAYPVAFEPRKGTLYVVTGRVTIHFKTVAEAAALSQDYSMELLRLLTRLNTATYQSSRPSVQKLNELLDSLRKDPRVVKADLEMIGEGRTAQ